MKKRVFLIMIVLAFARPSFSQKEVQDYRHYDGYQYDTVRGKCLAVGLDHVQRPLWLYFTLEDCEKAVQSEQCGQTESQEILGDTASIVKSCLYKVAEKMFMNGKEAKGYSVGYYKDGKRHYTHEFFAPNGNPSKVCDYTDGKLNGVCKEFSIWDGTLRYQGSYLDDKKEGTHYLYEADGQLHSEVNYQAGVLQGMSKTYFSDGKIAYEFTYDQGKQVYGKIYDLNGSVLTEGPDVQIKLPD